MFHVDNSTGVPVMPQPSPVTSEAELFFTEGGNGIPPTYPGPDWFNIVQSELLNIVRTAGISPDKMDSTQLLAALGMLFLQRNNPFGDIAQDGPEAIETALSNLRLGAGAPAIGIPFFWPSSAMPNTVMDEWANMVFLKWNGATFSAVAYPKLALVIPNLTLTEARGEFPRIWDDGRGVDVGRGLLSWQDSDNKEHLHDDMHSYGGGGAGGTNGTMSGFAKKYCTSADGYKDRPESGWLQASSGLHTMPSGGKEARPRNIAFNFLVRAK